ncbi:UNKNOWN [Stylonychia lemnae]|uniref:Uncharacterized protein n=1 Tax=Stylonychia lemnae TaxID=5949 RepID=A0A078BCT5_STYLE|nr:UNKNOWN [Stylonychia lemnae]|eukprot:CDW91032.1 UNKNOWN [Stylonychia lemnae]
MQSATGLVLGTRDEEKLYIYDVILTPNPENTQKDIKQTGPDQQPLEQKGLLQLLNTKYTEFNYSDWLSEFINSVDRMLTTGIEVVGLFTYSQSSDHKQQSFKKLNSLMTRLFTVDPEDEKEQEASENLKLKKPLKDQYILMSIYNQKVGQSFGDINLYMNNNLLQISEQIRNHNIIDRIVYATMCYPVDIQLSFAKNDPKIMSFREINTFAEEQLKQEISNCAIQVNQQVVLTKTQASSVSIQSIIECQGSEEQVSINFSSNDNKKQSGNKKAAKSGKSNPKDQGIILQQYEIPEIEVKKLNGFFIKPISDNIKYEHLLRIKGNLHLSCYVNTEKQSLKDLVNLLIEDMSAQFRLRLEILYEEAQNNISLVNPFDLNTDNMTRIQQFDLLLPRKCYFKLPDHLNGIKSKLIFNDYLLFFENNAEAQKRLFESTGLIPRDGGKLESKETISKEECDKKLLKIKNPILQQKHDMQQRTEQAKKVDAQLNEAKKEKTPMEISYERRQQYLQRQFNMRLAFFLVCFVMMMLSYGYVYFYLM